jgi:predicted phosphoribosyltransferase
MRLKGLHRRHPLVLAVPRGGVVVGAVLAHELDAELDVILARKLRAPYQPELAIGAVSEDGEVHLNAFARQIPGVTDDYLDAERAHQIAEIARRRSMFREARPAAVVSGRTVIVTDDGIATGSTILAALHVLKAKTPHEVIVAVPVAPPEMVAHLGKHCDRVECLLAPPHFGAVGAFYRDFEQVEDDAVIRLLREFGGAQRRANGERPASHARGDSSVR